MELTLSESLDQAVQQLPFVRRRVYQWRLNNSKFRARVLEDLQDRLSCCEELATITGFAASDAESMQYAFANDLQAAYTFKFNIDPENLKKWFDLIIEYLPKIIDLISKLFVVLLPFLIVLFSASSVMAQDCLFGRCVNKVRERVVVRHEGIPQIAPDIQHESLQLEFPEVSVIESHEPMLLLEEQDCDMLGTKQESSLPAAHRVSGTVLHNLRHRFHRVVMRTTTPIRRLLCGR